MRLKDFRVGLRILVQDPAFSLVSILGLGVGMAACLLLLGFARYAWHYNADVPDVDQVYVVKNRQNLTVGTPWFDQAPTFLRTAAQGAPGVAGVTGYLNWLPVTLQANGQLRKLKSLTVLPGFAEMLGVHAIRGDLHAALSQPDSFAITEEAAMRTFGTADVLGRTVRAASVEDRVATLRIAAVLRTPPANTTIPFEALCGVASALMPKEAKDEALVGIGGWWGYLLVRLAPGASLAAVTERLQQAVDRAPAVQTVAPDARTRLKGRKVMDIKLSPLRAAYFDRDVATNFLSMQVDRGDAAVVAGLLALAILILALAGINYVNLATIRVVRRQREICMRKVLGVGATRLALQFLAEALLVALLATAVGLLLAWLALPVFGQLMNRNLSGLLNTENLLLALLVGIALGLLTAAYPAWIAYRVRPSQALAGRPDAESTGSKRLRQSLSGAQIGAAMALASFTMAVAWQTQFAIGAAPGFDPAHLLVIDLPEPHDAKHSEQARGFMAALAHAPGVAGIAVASDAVGRAKSAWSGNMQREGGPNVPTEIKSVSANFFEQYTIAPVAGRLFDSHIEREDDPVPVVVNTVAVRQLGFATPELAVGQTLLVRGGGGGELTRKRIVGIAPELRFRSLREAPAPAMYQLWYAGATLTVRATAPLAEVERTAQSIGSTYFPNAILEMHPAKDFFAANYADDARLAWLLAVATAIALMLAAIGAYVLASDAVQRRTREIAVRKLYGARRQDIGKLVASELGAMVVIPAALGLPVAAVAIERYLAAYTERAAIGYWTLALALAVGLATMALAAARQGWYAMGLKPSAALRA